MRTQFRPADSISAMNICTFGERRAEHHDARALVEAGAGDAGAAVSDDDKFVFESEVPSETPHSCFSRSQDRDLGHPISVQD
jgi:hypothetical protein